MPQPLITLTLSFLGGLILGHRLALPLFITSALLSLAALLLAAVFVVRRGALLTFACLFFFPLGLHYYTAGNYAVSSLHPYTGEERTIEGIVLDAEELRGYRRFDIEAERIEGSAESLPVEGRLRLTLMAGGDGIVPGDRIRFRGRLRKPSNFSNPGGFDYVGYLRRRGITASLSLPDDSGIALMGREPPFAGPTFRFRKEFGRLIDASAPVATAGVLRALVIGSRGGLDEPLVDAFRRSGLAHILAVSGLHMGIVAYFFFYVARLVLSRSARLLMKNLAVKGAALMTLLPLTLYFLLSGMATPAVRAYILASVFLFSVLFEREGEVFNTLALAALAILITEPAAFLDPSFQLSFAAVIGIVSLTPEMERHLPDKGTAIFHAVTRKALLLLIVSLSAILATTPLAAMHFMELSTVGLPANLFALPLLGFVVLPLGALALLAAPLTPHAAGWLLYAAGWLALPAVKYAEFLGSLPFAALLVSPPSLPGMVFYYILLFGLFKLRRRRRLALIAVVPALYLLPLSLPGFNGEEAGRLSVTFLSVGQGESTVVRFPGGRTMVIDGGGFYDGSFDVGGRVVKPYLLSQGIRRIDYMVLTHPHPDHLNGLLSLAESFPVGEVWHTGMPAVSDAHSRFLHLLDEKNISRVAVREQSPPAIIGGATVSILGPSSPPVLSAGEPGDSTVNGSSIVLRISLGARAFLLAADLEIDGEEMLLKKGAPLRADVLKVPHHGSLSSSSEAFVRAVSPAFAVFTVGEGNRFRFPRPAVVDRYERTGARILRTDRDGAVTFLTDGTSLEGKTFYGPISRD